MNSGGGLKELRPGASWPDWNRSSVKSPAIRATEDPGARPKAAAARFGQHYAADQLGVGTCSRELSALRFPRLKVCRFLESRNASDLLPNPILSPRKEGFVIILPER